MQDKEIDAFYCSPYRRSLDTIGETAAFFGKEIHMDERLREWEKGTALSTILNYFDPDFGCEDFLRIIDWMPYIIELDFDGNRLAGKQEHLHIQKEFKGN